MSLRYHPHSACCLEQQEPINRQRRTLLKAALAGGGLALAGLPVLAGRILAAGHTEALLLSCMDYRLMDDIVHYMQRRNLTDKYDHVILAGASLGAQTDKYPAWGNTFWEHLEVAIQLHHIQKVIVMDHRDCGAYKVILGKDFSKNPEEETQIHAEKLRSLEAAIRAKYPQLGVDLLLMDLRGKVEMIS